MPRTRPLGVSPVEHTGTNTIVVLGHTGCGAVTAAYDEQEAVNRLVEYNVDRQIESLVASDEIPRDVDVVGVVCDFQDVYSGLRGKVHVVNVDGEPAVAVLRDEHPEIDSRVERLWEY